MPRLCAGQHLVKNDKLQKPDSYYKFEKCIYINLIIKQVNNVRRKSNGNH